MKIQRFEGRTADEALQRVQSALGPNAVVLQTRTIKSGGLPGLSTGSRVEVTAAVDTAREAAEEEAARHAPRVDEPQDLRSELNRLRSEICHIRSFMASGTDPEPLEPDLAGAVRASLPTQTITLRDCGPTIIALVGPTGVGKTTTLAKLAAAAARMEDKKVAFLTIDTYRIGAVQQLESYARLLQAPVTVAYCAEDVNAAIDKYARFDVVFVDTVGRSAANGAAIAEQAEVLAAARMDEVHLCLDAGKSASALQAVVAAFAVMRPTHVLLTKLDDAIRLDDVLRVALESKLPVSYVTTGQRVPEDVDAADAAVLAGMMGE